MNSKGRILIADDDEGFRMATKRYLQTHSYDCDVACNGLEAKEMLAAKEYMLLIADIDMPGNQHLDLITDTHKLKAGPLIILATGMPTMETAITSVHLAVMAYLIKPINPEDLLKHVAQASEKYRYRKTVDDICLRVAQSRHDMEKIENGLRCATPESAAISIQALVDMSIGQLTQTLMDLRSLTDLATGKPNQALSLKGLNESRPAMLLQALWQTVAILERTKNSFHSNELGGLRRKLQQLLDS